MISRIWTSNFEFFETDNIDFTSPYLRYGPVKGGPYLGYGPVNEVHSVGYPPMVRSFGRGRGQLVNSGEVEVNWSRSRSREECPHKEGNQKK